MAEKTTENHVLEDMADEEVGIGKQGRLTFDLEESMEEGKKDPEIALKAVSERRCQFIYFVTVLVIAGVIVIIIGLLIWRVTRTEDPGGCESSPCLHGGNCTHWEGRVACSCTTDYQGDSCQIAKSLNHSDITTDTTSLSGVPQNNNTSSVTGMTHPSNTTAETLSSSDIPAETTTTTAEVNQNPARDPHSA